MMKTESQRVVVIQDASRNVSLKGILKVLKKFSVKAGDQLIVVAVLDWISSPMGYMVRVDSSGSMISTNQKIIEKHTKKKEHYLMNREIKELIEYCKVNEIGLHIEVLVGPAAEVASHAAIDFQATSLILVRQMHKDMKHFMGRLPCGMFRITSDNSIEKLKDPKSTAITELLADRHENVRYREMFPGSEEEERFLQISRSSSSDLLTSTGVSSQWGTETSTSYGSSQFGNHKYQEGMIYSNIEQQTIRNQSLFHFSENQETHQIDVNQKEHSGNNETSHMAEEFINPLCSVCNNRRPKIGWKRDFRYAELYTATQGFSPKNFLSEGGFGSVYKGQLDGMKIAVKQHKNASSQGEKEFKSEVNVLSKARHENVVMLLGSCSDGNSSLLVYEYVCNGSLDQHLSEHSRSPLNWKDRINVAIGAAKGLQYLHENNIIHRDVRLNNILITHDHQPLLGDFGLARKQNQDSTHSTEVVGTFGYLAPEYAEHGRVSTKTDVYSFGVVLLQLITGMKTTDKRLGGRSLVGWFRQNYDSFDGEQVTNKMNRAGSCRTARPLLKDRNYPDLIDERIIYSHDVLQLFWMVRIAEKCLCRDPQKRLNMIEIVDALTEIEQGRTCDTIFKDYSPAMSGSFCGESYSEEYEDEMQGSFAYAGELQSHNSESAASNSLSQIMQMTVRQPPSPPIPSISSCSSHSFKFYDESTNDGEVQTEGNSEI